MDSRSRSWRALVAWCFLPVGCGAPAAPAAESPSAASPARERIEIAFLEAEGPFGLRRLGQLAGAGPLQVRRAAVRALGRIGEERALELLGPLLADSDPSVREEAIWAVALANASEREDQLVALHADLRDPRSRSAIARALGMIGSAAALPALLDSLRSDSAGERAAAAIALGLCGRRGIALLPPIRLRLGELGKSESVAIRYATAYALANEHAPDHAGDAAGVLVHLAGDPDAEVRAAAVEGIGRRRIPAANPIERALADDDWRVRVAAVQAAIALDRAELRAAMATRLVREWALLFAAGGGPGIHVIATGLELLADFAAEPPVRAVADALHDLAARALVRAPAAASLVHCRAAALRARAGAPLEEVLRCGGDPRNGWPRHERLALAARVLVASRRDGGGAAKEHLQLLDRLAGDEDPRVRAATLTALAQVGEPGPVQDQLRAALARGLGDPEREVAAAAAGAVARLADSPGAAARGLAGAFAEALVARAQRATDQPDDDQAALLLAFLYALARLQAQGAVDLCRQTRSHANASVREAARLCLHSLVGEDPGPGVPDQPPERPPAVPAHLFAKQVTWAIETSKGLFVVELDPDVAPWHVAALVRLSREHFYDGLLWHRVVPSILVQGGDPRGSGWGGPGFVIPAEPSPAWFRRGTVAMADAGLHTAGSQWFVTYGRVPHLEGRYTAVGRVVRGQDVVDSLMVGDRIVRTRVTIRRRANADERDRAGRRLPSAWRAVSLPVAR